MNPGDVPLEKVVDVLRRNNVEVEVDNSPDSDRITVSRDDISEVIIIGKDRTVTRRMVNTLARKFVIQIHLFYPTLN